MLCIYAYKTLYFFQWGDRLYTSASDVCRRQILTYKDGPRAEHVSAIETLVDSCRRKNEDAVVDFSVSWLSLSPGEHIIGLYSDAFLRVVFLLFRFLIHVTAD